MDQGLEVVGLVHHELLALPGGHCRKYTRAIKQQKTSAHLQVGINTVLLVSKCSSVHGEVLNAHLVDRGSVRCYHLVFV